MYYWRCSLEHLWRPLPGMFLLTSARTLPYVPGGGTASLGASEHPSQVPHILITLPQTLPAGRPSKTGGLLLSLI